MKAENHEFGAHIKEKRLFRNYTVEALAEKLDISASYLGLLERGDRKPSYIHAACKICDGAKSQFAPE